LLDGEDIWHDPKRIGDVRYRVGLVMQYPEYQLFEETVAKDIAYGPTNMGIKNLDKIVLEAAEFAGVDKELLEKSPFDLSGGQKRRVAIAGIMAMNPEILVLDEPAAGLDPRGKKMILEGIKEYQKKTGASVVIVSHSMEDMAKCCDELIVMSGSRVIMQGTCDEVFSQSSKLTENGLDVPQITKLMGQIKSRGFQINDSVYTIDRAYEELLKIFNK
jgi:energy-coupling factor transport system ATP-binding protein